MFTKIEVEKTSSTNYLLNTIEVNYDEFVERLEEIVEDQKKEIEHFSRMRDKAEEGGQKLAATHYAKRHMEIHERAMDNLDTLDLSEKMKDGVIFLMTGAVPSFIYVGRKKKMEHEKAKEDLRMIYF
jgi:flagellar biosynthesis chaperone FliJ